MAREGLMVAILVLLLGGLAGGCNSSPALGPGCFGSPGASCGAYPDGTQCPGGPTVCIACGHGVYASASSTCTCTSRSWTCGPPTPAQIHCSTPVVSAYYYTDSLCTVPYAGDGGVDAAPEADAAAEDAQVE